MAGWSWRCAGRLHQQVFIITTAPPCFITPTDCAKLLPDIFQTDPLSTNAQHDRCLIWWMYLKGMFCDTSLMSNSGRCYKYITIPGITLNQWHMSRMFIIKDTFTQKFIHSASCGSEVRWSFEINLGAFILCFVCFIYFFFFLKQVLFFFSCFRECYNLFLLCSSRKHLVDFETFFLGVSFKDKHPVFTKTEFTVCNVSWDI